MPCWAPSEPFTDDRGLFWPDIERLIPIFTHSASKHGVTRNEIMGVTERHPQTLLIYTENYPDPSKTNSTKQSILAQFA